MNMPELWIPQPDKHPNVANLYDMMMVFQEQLDEVPYSEEKMTIARTALRALSVGLQEMDDNARQVAVVTDLAIIDRTSQAGMGDMVKDIGLRGIIDDVHCVSVGEQLPWSVSLGIDVVSIFPHDNPDDIDYVLSNAKAPINKIHYIETLAS